MLERSYKVLKKQHFSINNYQIIPIRDMDKYDIMRWRNEQIYHLRQQLPLTRKMQDEYFSKVIAQLFNAPLPEQILFSYLDAHGVCIGYGGLVHINWNDKVAEISFIMDTCLELKNFEDHWTVFLQLIQIVAFQELALHKIFVYAYDLRPRLYDVLEKNDFFLDARLKKHVCFNNKFVDVVIYSKFTNLIL